MMLDEHRTVSLPPSFDWSFVLLAVSKLLESARGPPFLATNVYDALWLCRRLLTPDARTPFFGNQCIRCALALSKTAHAGREDPLFWQPMYTMRFGSVEDCSRRTRGPPFLATNVYDALWLCRRLLTP